ncbi:MAG: thioredoxin-dependent thiol peroxidase [Bacteroidetes bacterium]|nr:thioredoxin-dependent thiol peroxidase [Bacteroidota bacterium]
MTHLKVGDKAPGFSFTDHSGEEISLESYKNKKLILYFYPRDNTPGCTAEACNLRDNYEGLLAKGFAIVGVSADSEKSHLKFRTKYDLPFPLISDTEKEVLEAYGVWGTKKMAGRTYMGIYRMTFVIDGQGIIEKIYTKVKTKEHTEQILADFE